MADSVDLSQKTALITGGNKGIGLATAQLLAKHGAKIAVSGRDKEALQNVHRSLPQGSLAIRADISKLEEIDSLFEEVHKTFGGIDILFINAGVSRRISLNDAAEEVFDNLFDINFKGSFFTLQKSINYLNRKASVVFNASVQGTTCVMMNHSIYACTKAAIIQLAKSAAGELVNKAIRVNAISPMWVKTLPWDQFPDLVQKLSHEIPLEKRFTIPEEIAKAVLFLASDLSSHMTGQNLIVDGGVSTIMQHPNIEEFNTYK